MDEIFENLVTDRTRADASKGTDKGVYQAADLNRVEAAVQYAVERMGAIPGELNALEEQLGVAHDSLFDVPYNAVQVETKTDWAKTDIPTNEQMDRYLGNVATVGNALGCATSRLPENMEYLTYRRANSIEQVLQDIGRQLSKIETDRTQRITAAVGAWVYSGEIYSGG
jgi:hypothetical protein